jgi:hypothetical protein
MPDASLIVCERTGRWAAAWRKAFEAAGVPYSLVNTRSLAACEAELREAPSSMAAIELTPSNVEDLARFAVDVMRRHPLSRWLALAEPGLADCRWPVYEMGAVSFAVSVRELPRLTGIFQRHALRRPEPQQGLRDRMWARLPWAP